MSRPIPYQYICIEGNIGTGKTSLCEKIAQHHNCQLILEEFAENPFLKYFYENPARYAFTVELFFMTERHKQLQHQLPEPSLFSDFTLSDYIFWKSIIFGRKNLDEFEYKLLQNLFQILNNSFPDPELVVYLHRPAEQLLEFIQRRGRPFEQSITLDYLRNIQDSYFEFFRNQDTFPVLIVEAESLDFLNNIAHFNEIMHLLTRRYRPGVHRIALHL